MATIDELIVSLALDATKFNQGQKDAVVSLKKIETASNKTSKQLESHGKMLGQAFSALKVELLSIAAIFTSLSGIKNFIQDTVLQTAALDRMSTNLDMSAKDLAEWQLAAKNAGGTAEGMTAAIKSSSDALADLKLTGNVSETLLASGRYAGIGKVNFDLNSLKSGQDILFRQADIIKGVMEDKSNLGGINGARLAAEKMGIDMSLFNLMKGGSANLKSQLDAQKDLANSEANVAEASEKVRRQFDLLENEIKSKAIPWLSEFLDVLLSPEFRATMDALGKGLGRIAEIFEFVGKKIGNLFGWVSTATESKKGFLQELDDKIFGGYDKKSSGKASSNAVEITQKLIKMGWTPEQAAGIVGSLQQESGLNPNAKNNLGMYGIAQWNTTRRADFKAWSGKDISQSTLDEQLAFMNYELTKGKEKAAGDKIRLTKTAEQAAYVHARYYERPGDQEANYDKRASYADSILAGVQTSNVSSAANLPLAFKQPGSNSVSNNTHNVDTNISSINIYTQATDADGIGLGISKAINKNINFGVANASTGLS